MKRVGYSLILVSLTILLSACTGKKMTSMSEYEVLIGEDSSIVDKISNIEELVIDAQYFTKEDIALLKQNGVNEIYSYLNIGSVENFRPYYEEYLDITLDEYENWPEEKWVDVSSKKWQSFLEQKADELSKKGVDGLFLDNIDVYNLYPSEEIYNGIICILESIQEYDMRVIINGGDCFVKKCLSTYEGGMKLFDGVNQENVYTSYDFDEKSFAKNLSEEKEYFTEYLDYVLGNGYKAYVIEYALDEVIAKEAYDYSSQHGYNCYVSNNIGLTIQ